MTVKDNLTKIREAIGKAAVVSFDIFDTLIRRRVGAPEDIFHIMESRLGLPGVAAQRVACQNKASLKAQTERRRPHADLDEIYAELKAQGAPETDWEAVKAFELELETDMAFANPEIAPLFEYAKSLGKRVIATSDMYLREADIRRLLKKGGYEPDAVYVSSEAGATKYNGDLFDFVAKTEKAEPGTILHIGDNEKDDCQMALTAGWQAIHYEPFKWEFEKDLADSGIFDLEVSRSLASGSDNFWYRLGLYAGGPLYLGVTQWFRGQMAKYPADRIFFLSRDGYDLYNLLTERGVENAAYLKMSRRSVLLAGITALDEETLRDLPPYTQGQTVREVLSYLRMADEPWEHLAEAGLTSLDDMIEGEADKEKVKKLYVLNEALFLKKCEEERAFALKYMTEMGLGKRSLVFDCGWNGSSQFFLDKFLKAVGLDGQDRFAYIGILDTEKSRRQLKNAPYETYLFDINDNRAMQDKVKRAMALFELFFGAPEESVWYYDETGPVPEALGNDESYKTDILAGIRDFLAETADVADKYGITYSLDNAVSGVSRLIQAPTEEEAVRVGDLANVDGFAAKKNKKTYMARLTLEEYKANPDTEIYWPQGLVKRPDTDPDLKAIITGKYALKSKGEKAPDQVTDLYESSKEESTLSESELYKQDKERYGARCADHLKALRESARAGETDYDRWIRANETPDREPLPEAPKDGLLFSVVIPVYNVSDEMLRACIDSVLAQSYGSYELILVDDHSTWESVGACLRTYESDPHIKLIFRSENGHISRATNTGIEAASGQFIVFSDCDDVLAPNALAEFARLLEVKPELDFIYSDEDKLTEDGAKRHSPFFKPDWSPDTFMCLMYTNHLAAYRRSKVLETGLLKSEYDGTQDYDVTLRFMEHTSNDRVGHVPKVLYHWRERAGSIAVDMKAKPYAVEAMRRMKEDMLKRRGIDGRVSFINDISQYRVVYDAPKDAFVSVIIPSRDNPAMLRTCIDSIALNAGEVRYEIILVDNGSSGENRSQIESYIAGKPVTYLYEREDFNFSRMCNRGAEAAKGDYLLFLNDDIEIITRDFLATMAGAASQKHIGAVGVKLLYPNSAKIQHLGITNLRIGPSHALIGFKDQYLYYFGRNRADYDWLAVTAAALMVSRKKYEAAGGFDEELRVAYNDVDFCFKLHEMGLYNVVRNDVVLYHYESASRGIDDLSEEKKQRLIAERQTLYGKHPLIGHGDPFYNINLTSRKVDFDIELPRNEGGLSTVITGVEPYQSYASDFDYIIDEAEVSDGLVRVRGWYYTGDAVADNQSDVYLILNSGRSCLKATCAKVLREDVRDNIDSRAFLVGFVAQIDSAVLRSGDSYEIGLCLVRESGESLFRATGRLIAVKDSGLYPAVAADMTLPAPDGTVRSALDICEMSDGRLTLEGWAFTDAVRDHFDTAVRVVLEGESGGVYLSGVDRIERLDVARAYVPHEHLDMCGFRTLIELPRDPVKRIGIFIRDLKSGTDHLGWIKGGPDDDGTVPPPGDEAPKKSLREKMRRLAGRIKKPGLFLKAGFGLLLIILSFFTAREPRYILFGVLELAAVTLTYNAVSAVRPRLGRWIGNILFFLIYCQYSFLFLGNMFLSRAMLRNTASISVLKDKYPVFALFILAVLFFTLIPARTFNFKKVSRVTPLALLLAVELVLTMILGPAWSPYYNLGLVAVQTHQDKQTEKMISEAASANAGTGGGDEASGDAAASDEGGEAAEETGPSENLLHFLKDGVEGGIDKPESLPDKPNVILIFTEGLSQNIVDDASDLMVNVRDYESRSLMFTNYWDHTYATFHGLTGQLHSGYQRENTDPNYLPSLESIFKDEGYYTAFVNPEPYHEEFTYYLADLGFDYLENDVDPSHFGDSEAWISDRENYTAVFDIASAAHEEGKPFFVATYTFNTHIGWKRAEDEFADGTNDYANKFYSCDQAFAEFMERFEASPLFEDTLFIFTADHASVADNDYNATFGSRITRQHATVDVIPLFFYYKGVEPQTIDVGGRNSLALAPTVLDFLDISAENCFLGDSLFVDGSANPWNYLYIDDTGSASTEGGSVVGLSEEQIRLVREELIQYYIAAAGG